MANESPKIDGEVLVGEEITRQLRSRNSEYDLLTIKKTELEEHLAAGWEEVRENKNTFRVRHLKPHDIRHEDRVWSLFARLGFSAINADRNFRVVASRKGLKKQIDVAAWDEETAIIIECKSSEKLGRRSLQKDILEFAAIQNEIQTSIRKNAGKRLKVAVIFATNNIIVSQPDKQRLEESNIQLMTESDLAYFDNLRSQLGAIAKFQLAGLLFAGTDIPEFECNVPAIKGRAGKYTCYSFMIEPDKLLKMGFVLHRTDTSQKAFETYQRMIKKQRIKEICKYINGSGKNQGFFPNSIIVNLNSKRSPEFTPVKCPPHNSSCDVGILKLPKKYRSAFIIDGQHRLYGYANTEWRKKHTIPVVAFVRLPEQEQTKIFVDINHKQKSVPTNLLNALMSEFNWGSDSVDEALGALRTRLIINLNNDVESALYKRIVVGEEQKTETRCLTLSFISSYGLARTEFLGKTESKKRISDGLLEKSNYSNTLEHAQAFLTQCFFIVECELEEQWAKGSGEGGFIAMNIGVASLLRILSDILVYLDNTGVNVRKLTPENLATECTPYLKHVIGFVKSTSLEQRKQLRSFLGTGGVEKVVRELQNAINSHNSDFCPAGFDKWQDESSGKYNELVKPLAIEIQKKINRLVTSILKKELGEKGWWSRGVPKKVQKDCSLRRIEEGSGEDWQYLMVLEYKDIIKARKDVLINHFTPPGIEQAGIDKKLSWFTRFNSIRNKVSHPERESVTEEEHAEISEIYKWLCP